MMQCLHPRLRAAGANYSDEWGEYCMSTNLRGRRRDSSLYLLRHEQRQRAPGYRLGDPSVKYYSVQGRENHMGLSHSTKLATTHTALFTVRHTTGTQQPRTEMNEAMKPVHRREVHRRKKCHVFLKVTKINPPAICPQCGC